MKIIDIILKQISDDLNISKSMYIKAVSSYEAVGNYIIRNLTSEDNTIEVYPQGSFNLGTVIKPLTDKDDGYDIDLVVELGNRELNAKDTKLVVGQTLANNERYVNRISEGKRCWTMDYDGFHMDILPSLSNNTNNSNSIRITHKESALRYHFKESNPKDYKVWFDSKNREAYLYSRANFAKKYGLEVEDVPEYDVRSNLQIIIQLLKRHRDVMFKGLDDAPISIIITTLSAHAFINDTSLEISLKNVILTMKKFISYKDGKAYIPNPVNPNENFADKWSENANKKRNFISWLNQLEIDLIQKPSTIVGLDNLLTHYKKIFGENIVSVSAIAVGDTIRNLRESGDLYFDSSELNLTTEKDSNTVVKNHSFYGAVK